jgi:Uma2 family endonuclease
MDNPVSTEVYYPSSDGKPMAETDIHRDLMFEIIELLQLRYQQREDVYVSGNLLVYYERGNPRKHLAPDCFVVFGIPKHRRDNYKIWEEGFPPRVVFEMTSKSTASEDMGDKFRIYEQLWGVQELFLFDPTSDYLEPPLQGFSRVGGRLQPITPVGNRIPSQELGLSFTHHDSEFIVLDSVTGEQLLRARDQVLRSQAALEQSLAKLEDLLAANEITREAWRLSTLSLQAETKERERLEAEKEGERLARLQAEAELEKLRAELAALRQAPPS